MKQRLLLSLLMLMVSVGLVKASIDIKLPEKGGTVTIRLKSEGNFVFTQEDYPHLFINAVEDSKVLSEENIKGFDSSTLTYTYTSETAATLMFSTVKDRFHDDWGNISLTVNGSVKSIEASGGDWNPYIVGLTVENNGGILEDLALAENHAETGYFPNLTTLVIPDNKLANIPAKTDKMSTYSIGKVPYGATTEYAGGGENQTARSFLLLPSGLFASVHTYLKDIVKQSDLQIVALKDAEGNDITTYATGEGNWDQARAFYHFRNANKVYDKYGVFTADIKILSDSYPGVVLTGVKLNVQQAKFKLTIDNPDASKVAVSATSNGETINTNSELVCGQPFTLSAISQTGYQFAGFEVVEGATATDHEGDSYNFTVDGDNDITIKVKSEAASNKIVFEQDPAGTLEVLSDKGRLTTGSAITTRAAASSRSGIPTRRPSPWSWTPTRP